MSGSDANRHVIACCRAARYAGFMRTSLILAFFLVACTKPGAEPLDTDVPIVDTGDWATPTAAATWQWQLLDPVNTDYDVDVYDIDLFDVPDSTIETLHAADRLVVCYFSAGSIEDWRDDAGDFPEEAIGRKLDGWEGERWLDVRHPEVLEIMEARLDHAKGRGCDLVEPDNVDGSDNNTGFDLSRDDSVAYLKLLANAAHERGLGIAKKNGAETTTGLEPWFDAAVVEECAAFTECDAWDVFVAADKPVWQAEYPDPDTLAAAEELASEVCADAVAGNRRALILPLDLDDRFRVDCDEQ